MQKKLTITIDEQVYEGLHAVIGRRRISRFIEDLVRPYVIHQELEAAYMSSAEPFCHSTKVVYSPLLSTE